MIRVNGSNKDLWLTLTKSIVYKLSFRICEKEHPSKTDSQRFEEGRVMETRHIFCEGNQCVHHLANLAQDVPLGV
ncbi:hypothetical protein Gorai_002771, partial [Gossypium raimondii]|nr:hypothetical protein [Gossypium raimondii]